MKRSPLQLESCWLEFITLTPAGSDSGSHSDTSEVDDTHSGEPAGSAAGSDAPDDLSVVSEIETELAVLFHAEDPDVFRMCLRVKTPEPPAQARYTLDIKMTGQFRVEASYGDPVLRSRLVSNAAPSIVYGAIRDQVLALTTRASQGPWVIPTVMFPIHEDIVWNTANSEPAAGPSQQKMGPDKKVKNKKS